VYHTEPSDGAIILRVARVRFACHRTGFILSLPRFLFLSFSNKGLSVTGSLYVCLCLCLAGCLCLALSLYLFLPLSLSLCRCPLSLYVTVSLCQSLSLCHSLSLCLSSSLCHDPHEKNKTTPPRLSKVDEATAWHFDKGPARSQAGLTFEEPSSGWSHCFIKKLKSWQVSEAIQVV